MKSSKDNHDSQPGLTPILSSPRRRQNLAADRMRRSLVVNERMPLNERRSEDIAYTDLDPRCWKDPQSDILLDSLWLFPSRDKSGAHSGDYHGNFIPQVPNQVIRRFTRPGEVVVDLFSGSGTTMMEAAKLGRCGIGVELQPEVNAMAQERINKTDNPHQVKISLLTADSASPQALNKVSETLDSWGFTQAHHVILHPPYWDIITFSDEQDGRDLSSFSTEDKFYEAFGKVVQNAVNMLLPGRFLTLVIGDKYGQGQWIPLGFGCMEVCRRAGLTLKSINVKDIQGNEKGKGAAGNLWKYRAMRGGFYIFKHEYVMVFRKEVKTTRRPRTKSLL